MNGPRTLTGQSVPADGRSTTGACRARVDAAPLTPTPTGGLPLSRSDLTPIVKNSCTEVRLRRDDPGGHPRALVGYGTAASLCGPHHTLNEGAQGVYRPGCARCGSYLPDDRRADARYCSARCRAPRPGNRDPERARPRCNTCRCLAEKPAGRRVRSRRGWMPALPRTPYRSECPEPGVFRSASVCRRSSSDLREREQGPLPGPAQQRGPAEQDASRE